jgi:pimeloyl-ACP methyl ester carboxylesterase
MHWNPGSREDWNMLATLLQGAAVSSQQANQQGYAVFAFDFRGHGESGGSADRAGYLMDARAALDRFRTLPGVDPNWIIAIGASIGADAAVDACGEGCVGAVSLSPGAFLGIPYPDAVAAVGNKPVLCVAAQGDGPSPGACREGQAAAQGDYQLQIYQGSAHAMQMFDITEEEPALVDLIFQWLDAHVLPA